MKPSSQKLESALAACITQPDIYWQPDRTLADVFYHIYQAMQAVSNASHAGLRDKQIQLFTLCRTSGGADSKALLDALDNFFSDQMTSDKLLDTAQQLLPASARLAFVQLFSDWLTIKKETTEIVALPNTFYQWVKHCFTHPLESRDESDCVFNLEEARAISDYFKAWSDLLLTANLPDAQKAVRLLEHVRKWPVLNKLILQPLTP